MSLAFLAKKAWHTSNVKNVEKVWLAEQAHAKEEKRMEELRKQIEEERQVDELRALQNTNNEQHKVEWMYEGPGSAIASSAAAEEYKLGKAYQATSASSAIRELESKEVAGSKWLDNSANDANEQFSRLNQDPLLAMRAAQKQATERVLKNPVTMKRIKESLSDRLRDYDQRRQAKKLAKKDKKKKKKKSKKSSSRHRDDDVEEDERTTDQYGLQKGEKRAEGRSLGPSQALLDAAAAKQQVTRRPERKRKLTEEELEAKRREMAQDAESHEANRLMRMRDHRKSAVKEIIEEDDENLKKRSLEEGEEDQEELAPRFIRDVERDAMSSINLEESVQRHRNRFQKKRRAEDYF